MKQEDKFPVQGRQVPVPSFVDADWVESQIGIAAILKIPEISAVLAKKYDNWEGLAKKYEKWQDKAQTEQESDKAEFCGQIARDLGRPGFLQDVVNSVLPDSETASPSATISPKSSKQKKKMSKPFDFVIDRFVWANPTMKNKKKYYLSTAKPEFFHDSLNSVIKKWKDGDEKYFEHARDFLFFLPLMLVDVPEKKIAEMIKDTKLQPIFDQFWPSFEAAAKEYRGEKSIESIEKAKDKWRKKIDEFVAEIKKLPGDSPDMKTADEAKSKADEYIEWMNDAAESYATLLKGIEKDRAQRAARDMAEKLEAYKSYSKIPEIPELYKHLTDLKKTGDAFDADRYAATVDQLTGMLFRHEELAGEKKQLAAEQKSEAGAEKSPESEKLKDEISKIAMELMSEKKKQGGNEEKTLYEGQEIVANEETSMQQEQGVEEKNADEKIREEQDLVRKEGEERVEQEGETRSESAENAKDEWRKKIEQFAAEIKELSGGEPDMKKVEDARSKADKCIEWMKDSAESYAAFLKGIEKAKARRAARDLAEKLESYKSYSKIPEIPELYKHIMDLGETGNAFDADHYAVVVGQVTDMLSQHEGLGGEKRQLAAGQKEEAGTEEFSEAEKLKDKISETALGLMPELKEKMEQEEKARREEQELAAKKAARIKQEQELAAQKEAEKMREEQALARKEQEERARQEEEARQKAYAERINKIAANLIVIDEFNLAYHVACCGEKGAKEGKTDPSMLAFPSRALRFLAFPDLTGKGEIVGDDLNADLDIHSHDEDVSQSRKILVFAAALFPTLFHLPSNARALYGLRIDNCGGKLDEIGSAIQSLEGREISVEEFNESGKEDPAAEPIRLLKDWLEAKKQITLKYAPATRGWEKWVHEEGLLGSIILPLIGSNPDGGLNRAAEFVAGIDDGEIDKHIDAIPPKRIEGPVRMQLQENMHEVVSLIKNVVAALQSEERAPERRSETYQKCVAFRKALADADDDGFVQDGKFSDALRACIRRAASFLAEDAVENIFLGKSIKEIPGMAKITGARHDGQGNPCQGHSDDLIDQVEEAIENKWLTEKADDACERQIGNRALFSAWLIESKSDLSVVRRMDLEKIIKEKIPQLREQLEGRKRDVESMLDDSRVPGDLRDKWRKDLSLVIPQKIPAGDSEKAEVYDFPHAFEIVEAAGKAMSQARQESETSRG